jgi:FkbM family methyltransferase
MSIVSRATRFGTRAARNIMFRFSKDPEAYFARLKGVIHVGANTGEERAWYDYHNLEVIWIEPIPDVFKTLERNLIGYPRQRGYQCLITDKDNEQYEFHIANNQGQSSSILDLALHRDMFPDITYTSTISLQSTTLRSLVQRERIDMNKFDGLVLDTQGSELLVLQGVVDLLPHFRFIKTEASDFEVYKGCCTLKELDGFLKKHGFVLHSEARHWFQEGLGAHSDVYFRRAR